LKDRANSSTRSSALDDKTGGLTIQIDARCAGDQSRPINQVVRVAMKGFTQFLRLDGVTNLGQNVGVNSDLEWASPLLEQDEAARKSLTKQFQQEFELSIWINPLLDPYRISMPMISAQSLCSVTELVRPS
jgi:hypothetical protein